MLYGSDLTLPGELVQPPRDHHPDPNNYLEQLRQHARLATPAPTLHHRAGYPVYVPPDLRTCPAVYLRTDAVKRPLQRPYTGPHTVLQREDKHFVIDKDGRRESVTIDRLKPAYGIVLQDLPPDPDNDPPLEHFIPQLPLPEPAPVVPGPAPPILAQAPPEPAPAPAPPAPPAPAPPPPDVPVRTSRCGRPINLPARYRD